MKDIQSSIGCRSSDGSGPGEAVEERARRLARVCTGGALLALAACSPHRVATEAMLRDRGIVRPTVSAESGWLLGYCRWTEPYVARFVGMFEGRLVIGTVCATGQNAEDARLVDVHRPWPEVSQ